MVTLGILASGGGTTLARIVEACRAGGIAGDVGLVISNNSRSGAGGIARRSGIPFRHLSSWTHPEPDALDAAMEDELSVHHVEIVALAGFMKLVGPRVLRRYGGRILNTHPALLPDFGGRGMYGRRVHEVVLAAGVGETGVSIHLVDEEYDHGLVIAQRRVPVHADDDVEALEARVKAVEQAFYVETLARIADGRLVLP